VVHVVGHCDRFTSGQRLRYDEFQAWAVDGVTVTETGKNEHASGGHFVLRLRADATGLFQLADIPGFRIYDFLCEPPLAHTNFDAVNMMGGKARLACRSRCSPFVTCPPLTRLRFLLRLLGQCMPTRKARQFSLDGVPFFASFSAKLKCWGQPSHWFFSFREA
jgi:hypothetical protein